MFRYPLLCRDEVDSLNLRRGTNRAIYTRKKGRVVIKTRTSPYKRHNSSEIRRDLAKRKTGVVLRAILRYVGSYLITDKMCLLCGKVGVLFRARLM